MIYTVVYEKGIIKLVPTLNWIPNVLLTFSIWWLISHTNMAIMRCYAGVFLLWLTYYLKLTDSRESKLPFIMLTSSNELKALSGHWGFQW